MNLEVVPQAKPGGEQTFLADICGVGEALWSRKAGVRSIRVAPHSERRAQVESSVEIDLGSQEQEVGFQYLRNSRRRRRISRPVRYQWLLVAQPMPLIVQHDHDSGAAVPCPRPERGSSVSLHSAPVGTDVRSAATYHPVAATGRARAGSSHG
jgi:hypothetical protein